VTKKNFDHDLEFKNEIKSMNQTKNQNLCQKLKHLSRQRNFVKRGRSTRVEVKRSKYRKGRRYENGRSTEKVELMPLTPLVKNRNLNQKSKF